MFNGTDLQVLADFRPYDTMFTGGVRVALGDIDGDGAPDVPGDIDALFLIDPFQLELDDAEPAGATAQAITFGADWYAVVTADDDILIFDRATGDLRQRVPIHQKPE